MAAIEIPENDDSLAALVGVEVPSPAWSSIRYRLLRPLAAGGMSVAFLAELLSTDTNCAVVFKAVLPTVAIQQGHVAMLAVQKEVVALGRLNERVPPTPFVVRLFDTGILEVGCAGRTVELPWLVMEHVDGGVEGTTLTERVDHSIATTREAFDPTRAAHALECMAAGLDAVHEVGVIHRDVKPDNVLCCGFGEDEIFKVADFGIARPAGIAATFGVQLLGTLGYAPPEMFGLDAAGVAPASDVFSLAAVAYFMLTGEEYFPAKMVANMVHMVRDAKRRSVLESAALAEELRERPSACQAIDGALARATSLRLSDRPQSAGALAAEIVPWLRPSSRRPQPSRARVESLAHTNTHVADWTWRLLCFPGANQPRVRDVGWDADGCCLAATHDGLAFWDGMRWRALDATWSSSQSDVRFVCRSGPGRWIVGGKAATLASYGRDGLRELLRGDDPSVSYELMAGDPDDLLVVAEPAPQCGSRRAGRRRRRSPANRT